MRMLTESTYSRWILDRYPGSVRSTDGEALALTPMVPSDWQLLERFLREVPPEEKRFFRHEASTPKLVERWCRELDYGHVLPLLVWHDDRIAADGVLERDPGLWTAHVGKVRLLVHPEFRRRGLGTALLRELLAVARGERLHKLLAEVAAEQRQLIALLEQEGFQRAARLPEFIRDREGQLHDMVLMVHDLR